MNDLKEKKRREGENSTLAYPRNARNARKDSILREVYKLRAQQGDVVVICFEYQISPELLDRVHNEMKTAKARGMFEGVSVLVIDDTVNISILSIVDRSIAAAIAISMWRRMRRVFS